MKTRIPMNLAPGAKPRFYIARKVSDWGEGVDPPYVSVMDVDRVWSHNISSLLPQIRKLVENWDHVTNIVEVRAAQTGSEEYERLWTIHDIPTLSFEIGPHEDLGTW